MTGKTRKTTGIASATHTDLEGPLVEIGGYRGEGMTSGQARQLAAALLDAANAADAVDEITSATS